MFAGGTVFSGINSGLLNYQHRGLGTRGSIMFDMAGWSVGPWFNYWKVKTTDFVCIPGPICGAEPDNVTHEYGFKIVKDFW
jgi:hypothetical protein